MIEQHSIFPIVAAMVWGHARGVWHCCGAILYQKCVPCSAVIQKEDEEGKVGVKIGKELMRVAGMALKANITRLGPLVLPVSEQLIFAGNFVARKVRRCFLFFPSLSS